MGVLHAIHHSAKKVNGDKAGGKGHTDRVTISDTARDLAVRAFSSIADPKAIGAGGRGVAAAGLDLKGRGDTGKAGMEGLARDVRHLQSLFERNIGAASHAFEKGRIDAGQFAERLYGVAARQADSISSSLDAIRERLANSLKLLSGISNTAVQPSAAGVTGLAGVTESNDDDTVIPPGLVDNPAIKKPPGLVDNPAIEAPPGLVDNPAIETPPGLVDNPAIAAPPGLVAIVESSNDEILKADAEEALVKFMDLFEEYEDFFDYFADQLNVGSSDNIFDFIDTLTRKLEELERAYAISTVYLKIAEERGITPDLSLEGMVIGIVDQATESEARQFMGINPKMLQTGLSGIGESAVHVSDAESGTQGSQQVFRMNVSPLATNQKTSFGFKDHDPLAAYRQTQFVAATTSVISNMSAYV